MRGRLEAVGTLVLRPCPLFVATDKSTERWDPNASSDLVALDLVDPRKRSPIQGDLLISVDDCELSPDGQWLWVDVYEDRHFVGPRLFQHGADATFSLAKSEDDLMQGIRQCWDLRRSQIFIAPNPKERVSSVGAASDWEPGLAM